MKWLCLVATLAFTVSAQVLDDLIYTVGTTTKDATARDWGYVLWQGSTPDLTQNKHFAIYGKAGDGNSPNPYARQAIVGVQTDPAVIKVILNRAVNLGDDLPQLETRINNLFQKIMPPGDVSLAEKISIVIRGSVDDHNHFHNLIMLARLHPSISIALGVAHATLLEPGLTTFEVREYDLPNNKDVGVVGRVTLQAGVAPELPAPGAPVAVPENSAKGNLNVQLRWGTPDELRRLALLGYGFNVYRIAKVYAEANNFDSMPPGPAQIMSLASSNPNVRQLNNMPVLKNRDYTLATAPNLVLDPTNSFFADDNRRYEPGGVPHNNGDKFYYFIAARDVLGRNGKVSPGTLVTICDKLPPNSPTGVSVVNDYHYVAGVSKQVLKVRWKFDHSGTDTIKNYYVYRWLNVGQVQALAGNPVLHRIAGPIPHAAGQEWGSYVDDGPGSPSLPADASKTYWYTVRSEDDSACGGNLSANSAPAFGVLRDRVGPAAPGGFVETICRRPVVQPARVASESDREQDESRAYYTVICDRKDPGVIWADFYIFDYNIVSNYIGRVYYKPNESRAQLPYSIPRAVLANQREVIFYCRVGGAGGKISNYAQQNAGAVPKFTENRHVFFEAMTVVQKVRPTPGRKDDCDRHEPTTPGNPGGSEPISPVDVTITLTPGTKEYKLYRRIDFGTLTLIKQGPANFDDVTSISIPDEAMPPNAGSICYYGQLFDEHGNASPLTLLGDDCIVTSGTAPLPAPMLTALQIDGTEGAPKMNIKWFCPPYGVERFRVNISVNLPPLPQSISSQVSDYVSSTPETVIYTKDGTTKTNEFYTYLTPRIGPGFGNGAQFEVQVAVVQGKHYTVFIEAVGKDGIIGPRSNFEEGTWSPAILAGPKVPWPARPLPPFNLFSTNLLAERLPPSIFDGPGVRIGWIVDRVVPKGEKGEPPLIYTQDNPMKYIHTNSLGEKLFPVVMYRVQIPSVLYPTVSSDVVQVTPLMESIAYNVENSQQISIRDPFVRVGVGGAGTNLPIAPLYLIDTSPVLANAVYVYLLVRFNEVHEIVEVTLSDSVEVTP